MQKSKREGGADPKEKRLQGVNPLKVFLQQGQMNVRHRKGERGRKRKVSDAG